MPRTAEVYIFQEQNGGRSTCSSDVRFVMQVVLDGVISHVSSFGYSRDRTPDPEETMREHARLIGETLRQRNVNKYAIFFNKRYQPEISCFQLRDSVESLASSFEETLNGVLGSTRLPLPQKT